MSKEFKIGSFAVVILIISFFLINYLRGEDLFNKEIELVSRYPDVEGLVPSAPVFIKGYKAGKVIEVQYDKESDDFRVTCSVMKDFSIPEDSKMTIYSVDIMGGKGIRIDYGTSSKAAEDGAVLVPSFEAGLMDGLSAGVGPLLEKVTSTMDSLAVTVSSVNSLLSVGNRAAVSSTLAHLNHTVANLDRLSAVLEGKSGEVETFIDELSSLSVKFSSIAEKVDTAMTGVSSVVNSLSEADLAGLVTAFKELLIKIDDPDGTIGKLLVDDSVYDSVDALLSDVDELVRKIQENPKKYIKISVF